MYLDYLLYMIPGLLLSLFAQFKVRSAYTKMESGAQLS